MTWSRFAQSLIAALILSSLTVACGKSDRKEKISLRTGGGANKVANPSDAVGTEKDSLTKASEKLNKNLIQLQSIAVKDSDIEEALDVARKATAINIENLPVGKYRLAQIRNSLFISNIKSPFKGLQILDVEFGTEAEGKATKTYSVQNEHSLKNFKDELSPQILQSEFSVIEDQAVGRVLKLDDKAAFIFAGIFNSNKTSAFSVDDLEGEKLFAPLSNLNDTRKARLKGSYEGPEDKAKKLSSYFKIAQISESSFAITFSTEVGAQNSIERIRNLIMIYTFEKEETPVAPVKTESSPAPKSSSTATNNTSASQSTQSNTGGGNTPSTSSDDQVPANTSSQSDDQVSQDEPAAQISSEDVGI